MIISVWEVVLGAPDRVNILCLVHDTRLCQLDVKMSNNYHGIKSIKIQNLSRCKKKQVNNQSVDFESYCARVKFSPLYRF